MIFLVIFGGLMLILSAFYLVNSWQQYGTWMWATFLVIISIAMTAYGVWKLPYWNGNTNSQQQTASSQTTSNNSNSASSMSGVSNTGLNGMTGSQTEEKAQKNILGQLQKNFQTIGSVEFDSKTKTYNVTPTSDDVVKALNYLIENPSKASQVGWTDLTKTLLKTSQQIKKVMGDGYSISLLRPDGSKTMYTVKDGKATYDMTK
ncbi:DUF308 domain-containing protein [Paucilactobacillus sp. N302-9]